MSEYKDPWSWTHPHPQTNDIPRYTPQPPTEEDPEPRKPNGPDCTKCPMHNRLLCENFDPDLDPEKGCDQAIVNTTPHPPSPRPDPNSVCTRCLSYYQAERKRIRKERDWLLGRWLKRIRRERKEQRR